MLGTPSRRRRGTFLIRSTCGTSSRARATPVAASWRSTRTEQRVCTNGRRHRRHGPRRRHECGLWRQRPAARRQGHEPGVHRSAGPENRIGARRTKGVADAGSGRPSRAGCGDVSRESPDQGRHVTHRRAAVLRAGPPVLSHDHAPDLLHGRRGRSREWLHSRTVGARRGGGPHGSTLRRGRGRYFLSRSPRRSISPSRPGKKRLCGLRSSVGTLGADSVPRPASQSWCNC